MRAAEPMTIKRRYSTAEFTNDGPAETTSDLVRETLSNAKGVMSKAGFDVGNTVQVAVDPKLPFMGYTIPTGRNFRIVVSGMAVKSGMLEPLLIHEMSHVYRMRTHHPSHNQRVISEVVNNMAKQSLSEDYQQKIISELVNHIQDLYADDIAVKVIKQIDYIPNNQLSEFLQDWVKHEPIKSNDARRDIWVNAAIMVNNARALSQMKRHRIEDVGNKASTSSMKFLSQIPPVTSREFEYFRNVMTNLKEEITEEGYRGLLSDYLDRFVEMAEKTNDQ